MKRPFARLLLGLISLYRLTASPALSALGVRCRHAPTCSAYAAEAVGRHGAWAGSWMALARLARCRPWGSSGIDPAPTSVPAGARWWAPWRFGDWRGPKRNTSGRCASAEGCENAEAHVS